MIRSSKLRNDLEATSLAERNPNFAWLNTIPQARLRLWASQAWRSDACRQSFGVIASILRCSMIPSRGNAAESVLMDVRLGKRHLLILRRRGGASAAAPCVPLAARQVNADAVINFGALGFEVK